MDRISKFFGSIWENISSPEWLAGEVLSWLIFTALVTVAVSWFERWRIARENERYQDWSLRIVSTIGSPMQKLYPDEVKRFLDSDFELWKMVKSVVSAEGRVHLMTVSKALDTWVLVNRQDRSITVDLTRIPPADFTPHPAGRPVAGTEKIL